MVAACVLYFGGLAIYLSISGSGPEIQLLTAVMQAIFLLLISLIAWKASCSAWVRAVILVLALCLWAVAATCVDSKFISSLRPLHAMHFAVTLAGYMLEVVVFLSMTWLLERVAASFKAAH